jgi:ectoine hydroxylase-related dioxygenase (phytanoyl-CoA dioxygenase family)
MKAIDYRNVSALKEAYEEEGFCLAEGIYTDAELDLMETFFEEFKNAEAIFDGSERYSEMSKAERQIRALHPHRFSEEVKGWFLEPRLAMVLEALFEKPPLGAQTMYYYKPPGARGQAMHQDNFSLMASPATCIGAWSPIDDADLNNGCLQIVPGSHRHDIFCPDGIDSGKEFKYGESHITHFPRDRKPEPVPVKRGQTLLFHGNTIHGSGPNRTKDRYRRTFIGHYVSEETESLAKFYHPILNMLGETVSNVEVFAGGGPCGENWLGATH